MIVPNALKDYLFLLGKIVVVILTGCQTSKSIGGKNEISETLSVSSARVELHLSLSYHSEDAFNAKNGSIKTNRIAWVEKDYALDYWASMVVFGHVLAFA